MSVNSDSGSVITLQDAKVYTSNFREKFPLEIKAFFVGKNNVQTILDQEECMGIRIYNGYDDVSGNLNQVLVGVNSFGKDITGGVIVEKLVICPPICDVASELLK